MPAFDRKALLYGISAMSCSMLHCIFVSFYIDYFVRQNIMRKVEGGGEGGGGSGGETPERTTQAATLSWFIVGQVVYAVWNALNDLGFGWLSDTSYRRASAAVSAVTSKSTNFLASSKIINRFLPFFIRKRLLSGGNAGGASRKAALSRRRLSRVAIGGPLWAAAFAFLWYPTPSLHNISPALELSIKMIIYDGFFSYTTVSFRALLVDITTDGQQRELCNLYASVGHVIGSIGVMLASQLFEAAHGGGSSSSSSGKAVVGGGAAILPTTMLPDGMEDGAGLDIPSVLSGGGDIPHGIVTQKNLSAFRTFCFFWALAAAIGFILSATAEGNKEVTLKESNPDVNNGNLLTSAADGDGDKKNNDGDGNGTASSSPEEMTFFSFVNQTIRRAGMITVLIVWFLQDYSCTFATNFFSLFLTLVAAPHISPFARSVLLLISFIIPHAITIAATPFIPTLGKKFLVSLYLGTRTAVGVAFLFLIISLNNSVHSSDASHAGSSFISGGGMLTAPQTYLFATLLMLNRVLTEAVCRTQGLIISDVCDEDTIAFNRPASMAGAIHGLVNVVSRPSQSVSPVLSCLYLASYGVLMPSDEEEGGSSSSNSKKGPSSSSHATNGALSTAIPICQLLAITTIFTTLAMQYVWRRYYNLDGSYLAQIRMQMAMRVNSTSAEEGKGGGGGAAAAQRPQQPSQLPSNSGATIVQRPDENPTVMARKAALA